MQETQSPPMSSLPLDQPFRYDGPIGSHGREAGFLFHSSIEATPIPGTPDSQSLRWRLISGSFCVCSFCAPHGFPPTLTSSSGARLQPQSTFGFPFFSSVVHDRLMHLFCPDRRSCGLIPWFFGTPLIFPLTVVVLLWTSFSLRLLCQPQSLSTWV